MRIEPLRLQERDTAEALWLLQHAAYRVEASLIGVADLPPLRETIEELQACGELFWGCRSPERELAGALSVELTEEEGAIAATICRVMVHPDWFRQGVGSLLLRHAIGELPARCRWEVTAEARNLPAIALYEKFGFRRADTFSPRPDIVMHTMIRP